MGIPELLINVFSDDKQVLTNGTNALRLVFLLAPVMGIQMVTGGVYQALGKAKISFIISMSRHLFFLIPIVLTLPHLYGLKGVWLSIPLADGLASLLALTIFLKDRKLLFPKKVSPEVYRH